jgi:hypothetical protein
MSWLFTAFFLLIMAFGLVSCTSADEKAANQKAVSNGRQNVQNTNEPAKSSEPATDQALPVNEQQPDVSGPGVRKSRMDALRDKLKNDAPPVNIDIEAELKKSTRPAPENSEFAVVLADSVFERRTFKNHPKLLKVEKVTEGTKKSIKVFLTDGKVIDLPGEKIDFISTASSATILQAAGVAGTYAPRKPNSKPGN